MYYTTFFRCRQCFCKVVLAANYEPQATKSFLIQQFFKNAGEVWASSPHLRSKSNFQMKCNKNLRENRKESQRIAKNRNCLFNREAAMRIQGFRGNCDPKASWGCAPALPNQIQVVFLGELLLGKPIFSVRQKGVPPLLLPASVLQLPRCLVRIYNLASHNSALFELDSF